MRIGVIGTGTIAGAVVRGIAGDGHQITVSERSTHVSAELVGAFDNVSAAPNQQVLDQSDVIFLGLMAEVAPDILAPLTFREDQQVISFMAGADLGQVGEMIAPARASAVMMPFPGIAQGGSAIMALGDTDLVNEIFGTRNRVFALKDSAELDAYLCAQAVLSPVARMVGDAADWLGERVADPAQGEAFLRMLVATSLAETGCADLIAALNTPGGYNQRLRQHMEAAGMTGDLMSGLNDLEG
ncbi:NAD(P)-binding domain-containing protein [Phaeobacter gallaeciensis]|uniref:NAD(P)-binding domain-containing protein n=1 Tax=Phaeobacter gallaeciensis TaxID=60890 RepID=UPI0023805FB8|nr:NAD(P)-binding domain-containing protein [Phaeobacter gallaeciensis]MDE4274008.1 NAD(P)-binding domain-containing protein [Phaeobacter gallaeciensis]MDE4299248.1 NAD(P)-binding domain-containing protein [Phaeobacter gallaeciensis]MDE5183994.1 NAD(P)-binding domain-containing protein [Phaeobacter gallaeciensis]